MRRIKLKNDLGGFDLSWEGLDREGVEDDPEKVESEGHKAK